MINMIIYRYVILVGNLLDLIEEDFEEYTRPGTTRLAEWFLRAEA
jgi:hypothetical protein